MKTNKSPIEDAKINKLKNEQNWIRTIGMVLLLVWLVCFPLAMLSPVGLAPCALVGTAGLGLTIRSFAHSKFACLKNKNKDQIVKQNTPETNTSSEPIKLSQIKPELLMTSQLVAFYLNKPQEGEDSEYRNLYISRLMRLGIPKTDAEKLFNFESEIIKKYNKEYLLSPNFTLYWFFGLQQKFFNRYPQNKDDILKERFLTISEICKIIDEAEWHFWNSHERMLADDVWREICQWRLKGPGGDFAFKYFLMIIEATGISQQSLVSLVQEQAIHLNRYKWGDNY